MKIVIFGAAGGTGRDLVEQDNRQNSAHDRMADLCVPIGAGEYVCEIVEELRIREYEGCRNDQTCRLNVRDKGTNNGVDALVLHPAGSDALVDDVGLLEEELPAIFSLFSQIERNIPGK
jgi:hypothetical protein